MRRNALAHPWLPRYPSRFSVVHSETDTLGDTTYCVYSEVRGCVGYVIAHPDGTREHQGLSGRPLLRKPPTYHSAWEQAVDDYREVNT